MTQITMQLSYQRCQRLIAAGMLPDRGGQPLHVRRPALHVHAHLDALRQQLRRFLLQHAVTLLSGPHGLAAQLRTHALEYPFDGHSQPLDLGTPTSIVLRRCDAPLPCGTITAGSPAAPSHRR